MQSKLGRNPSALWFRFEPNPPNPFASLIAVQLTLGSVQGKLEWLVLNQHPTQPNLTRPKLQALVMQVVISTH